MYKYIIVSILIVLTFMNLGVAQVYVSPNDTVSIGSGSGVVVEGDLYNNGFVWNGGEVSVNGSYHNQNGSTSCGLGDYTIAGNFLNLGRIKCSSNKVVIDGSKASIINFGTDTIGELILEKSIASTVTLVGNLIIANSLQFNSDVTIQTNSDTLILLNSSTQAVSTNAPYNNQRYIKGYFSRKVVAGASYVFPVGNYNLKRADIKNIKNLTGSEMITVYYKSAVQGVKPLNVANEGPYDSICSPGSWVVVSDLAGSTAKMDVRLYTDNMYMSSNMKCAVLKRPLGSTSAADWTTGSGWLRTLIGGLSLNIVAPNYAERFEVQGMSGEYGLGNELEHMEVKVKAILSGPWNGTAMNTSLNTPNLPNLTFPTGLLDRFALTNPYNQAPWNYTGGESVAPGFFTQLANKDIVDWVLIELRTSATTGAVARKAGFIKKDGTVVDVNGTDPVRFDQTAPGNYYIVVKHRNHLPVMSSQPVSLPNADVYDFTSAMDKAYGFEATSKPMQTLSGGKFGMWAGDANSNYNVRYSGPSNDVSLIQVFVGGLTSLPVLGYFKEDVNLNGNVRYSGPSNDVSAIQVVVGGLTSLPKYYCVPNPNL